MVNEHRHLGKVQSCVFKSISHIVFTDCPFPSEDADA